MGVVVPRAPLLKFLEITTVYTITLQKPTERDIWLNHKIETPSY